MAQSDRAQSQEEPSANSVPGVPGHVTDLVNRGFQRIVTDPEDIEQLVAYGLYKAAKHKWAINQSPKKAEADNYYKNELASEEKIDLYMQQANQMVLAYTDELIRRDIKEIITDYLEEEHLEDIKSDLRQVKTNSSLLWNGAVSLGTNIVAWALIVVLTLIILAGMENGISVLPTAASQNGQEQVPAPAKE